MCQVVNFIWGNQGRNSSLCIEIICILLNRLSIFCEIKRDKKIIYTNNKKWKLFQKRKLNCVCINRKKFWIWFIIRKIIDKYI
jgi:hypothetical protein